MVLNFTLIEDKYELIPLNAQLIYILVIKVPSIMMKRQQPLGFGT